MSKFLNILKKSYVYIILIAFYIPLAIGVMYSFQVPPKRGDTSYIFSFSGQGWNNLFTDKDNLYALLNSLIIGLSVALIVSTISLLAVYAMWRSKSKFTKRFVMGTSSIPLINPDIITALSLSLAFSAMFGILKAGDQGIERVIIGHSTMIIPFGITILYPKSETFKHSVIEASKDLGYGPVKTWFKTYFQHMYKLVIVVFLISIAWSFDDFIIARTVSRAETIGVKMYSSSFRPWILALGTIVMGITVSSTLIYSLIKLIKEKKVKRMVK